ncbi:N-acetyltransferase [Ponticaulis sp.]|uniref:GNAT family N-acetyltransferase n=1 Tax=Ponticaulis sp. TaxID=2020902 RepID=UPI000B759651|nr:GNAT family N-acetyltransferase [Ponticaulis sp.]MAI90886.1 hypothetical protein [Ponticaulis sp.]OUX98736.1 MAG: hypothetical protein CBB65_10615 [Hyphomonadaceae bacterium TMED5]|tara:strand:+ start:37569 stop:38195 length:627 start_codon:yes stop_codon:yes gene_type:complete
MQFKLAEGMREAGRSDWKQLGDILGEAFAEDPINDWIFENPRAITSLFRIMADDIYTRQGFCHLIGDDAAAMWLPMGVTPDLSRMGLLRLVASQMRWGAKGALKRGMGAGAAMEAHHPETPHLYLFAIGTRNAARGKGLGKALLRPVLEIADREGWPIYLENSNPVNSGFYRANGFEQMGEPFPVGEGSPVMEPMWRAPAQIRKVSAI